MQLTKQKQNMSDNSSEITPRDCHKTTKNLHQTNRMKIVGKSIKVNQHSQHSSCQMRQ